ncbi:2OG-Fe(II) oxygenase [Salpingoeca rosetta]|uniref:2OG-Fe(II) oxygenase n=1 Tax=Salpingoeca rosetta (strain ATCC 50818 / BSB-021) TaxID=946362 RepID=F2UG50_SALR5|nr:2OG-Fe(II) oxygenase [Salpingoeca rosetta]EGD75478.1 2OG-Fe(II) oxygenase [Salpingoeca rosetta]|eukprot:XP_004991935.1 2OG-Fe(II) oxygenase [Salpingoeca rosetta]
MVVTRVDWRRVAAGSETEAVAAEVDAALARDGLLLLENVVPREEAQAFLAAAEAFFAQPRRAKDEVGLTSKDGFMRGYLSYGAESGQPDRIFEPKEGFSYGYEWPEDRPANNALQGPNRWPDASVYSDAQGFRARMGGVFDTMTAVAARLVEVIGIALGRDPEDMREVCKDGDTISLLRVFHYHPASAKHKACLGSSPHTDWGFLTTILQDDVGGLQFQSSDDGAWHDVPCVPGSLVINGGDFLQIISRGRYKSPVHRVLCPEATRTSFVLFYYPAYDTPMDAAMFTPVSKDYNTFLEIGDRDKGKQEQGKNTRGSSNDGDSGDDADDGGRSGGDGGDAGDGSGEGNKKPSCFGDYICLKWQQVQAY